jgi:hypothetical protein
MTAFPNEDVKRRAREHGAVRILEKPFDVFGLDQVLQTVTTERLDLALTAARRTP